MVEADIWENTEEKNLEIRQNIRRILDESFQEKTLVPIENFRAAIAILGWSGYVSGMASTLMSHDGLGALIGIASISIAHINLIRMENLKSRALAQYNIFSNAVLEVIETGKI